MPGIRKDIATLGAGWSAELEWYAKAVAALQALTPDARTSWRYLAAIHGFDRQGWLDANVIAPGDPLPPASEWNGRMWQQCQHQSWYFLPWHRGYLATFEAIVAKTIADLGGPGDWTLPYWNYLNTDDPNARNVPPAFLDPTLPDGSPNPLSAPPRSDSTSLHPTPLAPVDINLKAMDVHRFTAAPRAAGFGGPATIFNHGGNQNGALESNPHNTVHVVLGGDSGFMADPDFAGLDPIFWLHHCNIDRLWAAWLTQSNNVQENGAPWSGGPTPRVFEMPDPQGNLAQFTPAQTLPGGPLAPTYDDLTRGTGLGGAMIASVDDDRGGPAPMPATFSAAAPPPAVLVGANSGTVTVGAQAATTSLTLHPDEARTAAAGDEQHLFLNLENVRGTTASGVLSVVLSVPAQGATPASAAQHTESVALFGLKNASSPDKGHGNGLSVALDITDVARQLAQSSGAPLGKLDVQLTQPAGGDRPPITVGRVSLYRQPVE